MKASTEGKRHIGVSIPKTQEELDKLYNDIQGPEYENWLVNLPREIYTGTLKAPKKKDQIITFILVKLFDFNSELKYVTQRKSM